LRKTADGTRETGLAIQGKSNSYQVGRRRFNGQNANSDSGEDVAVTCVYCQKKGHRKNEWRKFKSDQRRGDVADRTTTAAHAAPAETPNISQFTVFSTAHVPADVSHWLLDSGCSNDVTGSRNALTMYTPSPKGNHTIRVANNSELSALGRGDVTLNMCDAGETCGMTLILHDILHVPDCRCNSVLSMSPLRKLYLFVDFHHAGGASLRRQGAQISSIEGIEILGLYKLRTMLERDDSYGKEKDWVIAVTTDREAVQESALWHWRLAHRGLDAVSRLSKGVNCYGVANTVGFRAI